MSQEFQESTACEWPKFEGGDERRGKRSSDSALPTGRNAAMSNDTDKGSCSDD